jgi:hypothetical protein
MIFSGTNDFENRIVQRVLNRDERSVIRQQLNVEAFPSVYFSAFFCVFRDFCEQKFILCILRMRLC